MNVVIFSILALSFACGKTSDKKNSVDQDNKANEVVCLYSPWERFLPDQEKQGKVCKTGHTFVEGAKVSFDERFCESTLDFDPELVFFDDGKCPSEGVLATCESETFVYRYYETLNVNENNSDSKNRLIESCEKEGGVFTQL